MQTQTAVSIQPDLATIKSRQQQTWSSGDYAVIGTPLQLVGESLCEALDLRPGSKVLDVAAGNGNATLAAARRECDVVSTDYVPALLERARARAAADGLDVRFEEADAENLPYPDASFDAVLSTFGVMFTANQERAAAEMARVCREGGRIGLANWTPESFVGGLFKTIATHVPPPAGVKSPLRWGAEEGVRELFAGQRIQVTRRQHVFRYRSPQHWLDTFRTYYGPMHKAFAALDAAKQKALAEELLALARSHNRIGEAMVVPSDYLEVVVTVHFF
jgi:SAM-dependent methyltransferase